MYKSVSDGSRLGLIRIHILSAFMEFLEIGGELVETGHQALFIFIRYKIWKMLQNEFLLK